MLRRAALAAALASCLFAGLVPVHAARAASAAPVQAVQELARQPHDPAAFTQGLAFDRGQLVESTGLYGQSSLRRVAPATGRVLARHKLPPELFGEGLTLCPGTPRRLCQLTWREGLILTYDADSLGPRSRHALRGQGWGLAWQGDALALSDGSATLRFLDARSLAETGRTLAVRDGGRPVPRLNELEWVNGWLLANVWLKDRIAVIRPDTGQVALWLDLSALRRALSPGAEAANGIAFDPDGDGGRGALYLTGKRWDTVFVARLPELLTRPPAPRP